MSAVALAFDDGDEQVRAAAGLLVSAATAVCAAAAAGADRGGEL
jgi:hypothetical protein